MIRHASMVLRSIGRLPKHKRGHDADYDSNLASIYILYNTKRPIYVGLTVNLFYRIKAHVGKKYTHYRFLQTPMKQAREIERLVISFLHPTINSGVNNKSILAFTRAINRK